MVIRRILELFRRRPRAKSAIELLTDDRKSAAPSGQPSSIPLVTWESELRAIGAEASAWSVETGGDLFGRWDATPTVYFATRAGPDAERNNTHFRLDVDYLRKLSEPLASEWALRYFGDWHSHHRLGLSAPSSGDRRRIRQVGRRNSFPAMAEIIVTLEGSQRAPTIRIHPWRYELSAQEPEPVALGVKVLPGISPVREALIARSEFPEQELTAWEAIPLERVRIGDDRDPPRLHSHPGVDANIQDRALSHLTEALKRASGSPVEQHSTAFGSIVVAQLQDSRHLAFALDKKWPMNVLEVHRINRDASTTEPIKTKGGLAALNVSEIIEVFEAAKAGRIV